MTHPPLPDLPEIRSDYTTAFLSRELSIVARKEVALGRAGFVILGEGKELAQIAMAKVFQPGDWRSGYYRDQTFMLAKGALTPEQFFAQVYAHSDVNYEPSSGGRQMNGHYASRYYTKGTWHDQTQMINVAADMSCTSGQLPRLIGLGYSSRYYRHLHDHHQLFENAKLFSQQGNEVAFGTIGDAATAEGHFWETVNAMGVLQIPVALSVWDNGYGISVPTRFQTTKGSLAKVLPGFCSDETAKGVEFYHVKGWDYPQLISTYHQAIQPCRTQHQPCVILVDELTQPLGHSSSGSHTRYKSTSRLAWERQHDCLTVFKSWILHHTTITTAELTQIETEVKARVQAAKDSAYAAWQSPHHSRKQKLSAALTELKLELNEHQIPTHHPQLHTQLTAIITPTFNSTWSLTADPDTPSSHTSSTPELTPTYHHHQFHSIVRQIIHLLTQFSQTTGLTFTTTAQFKAMETTWDRWGQQHYRSQLFSGSLNQATPGDDTQPQYREDSELVDGRELIRDYFHQKCGQDPRIVIIGEDVGYLGGVNLEFEGLKETYPQQIIDTGIRELTILGQGHGMAMRGFRPVVDIQYLDYLLFCLQGMSDDIACLHYRSAGGQVSPLIIRTKGHRLMGIWHSGSPMAMILNACRGIHLCVPRNMSQACGIYETLFHCNDPGLVIEPMNGYRKKERSPANLSQYRIPLGEIEILHSGHDLTIVTYGACCAIVTTAAQILSTQFAIHAEVIDCQTLHPFDQDHQIKQSLSKTHSLLIVDEDVPGGASAYILTKILTEQLALEFLDTPPITIHAAENRPAYSLDGDYYCKPQVDDVLAAVLRVMHDKQPARFA